MIKQLPWLRWPQKFLEWVPFGLAVLLAIFVGIAQLHDEKQPPPKAEVAVVLTAAPEFTPLAVQRVEVITTILPVGGEFIFQDGICNNAGQPVSAIITFGVQEDKDALLARKIVFIDGELSTFPAGCSYLEPIRGPLPQSITPGRWRLYGLVTVMGLQAGQIQRITILSNVFEVTP